LTGQSAASWASPALADPCFHEFDGGPGRLDRSEPLEVDAVGVQARHGPVVVERVPEFRQRAVIAIDGAAGTLSELGHALDHGRPVAGLDTHGVDLEGFRAVESPRAAVEFVEARVGDGG
jgi:hypothetical protein